MAISGGRDPGFHYNPYLCYYYGQIIDRKIEQVDVCTNKVTMQIFMEKRKDMNPWLDRKFPVSFEYDRCTGKKDKLIKYYKDHLPEYGKDIILGEGGIGHLNFDGGVKYRYSDKLYTNTRGVVNFSNYPICKGGIVREYQWELLGAIVIIFILGITYKMVRNKPIRK